MDIAKLRDQIEQTEHESLALKSENETIRRRLQEQVPLTSSAVQSTTAPAFTFSALAPTTTAGYLAPPPPAPEYSVCLLSSSESLNTPIFQVQRTSTPSPLSTHSGPSTRPDATGTSHLSEAQTDHAINFILGLEHICWNHFHPSYYSHQEYDPEGKEHGHSLMASTIALQSAPPEVWSQIGTEKERFKAAQLNANPSNAIPDTTTATSTSSPNVIASWQTPASEENVGAGLGLTLESLHGLASTLNPPDRELAPVQAWFEIARLYGADVVLDAALMDRVRNEMARDVDCLHFGAVIQREAFEGVLERVLGPVPYAEGG